MMEIGTPLGPAPPAQTPVVAALELAPPLEAPAPFAEILLLEPDDAESREFSGSALQAGVACFRAASAGEALRMLAARPFDGIILSLDSKGSLDSLKRIRSRHPEHALIAVARDVPFNSVLKALKLGASSYASKPLTGEDAAWLVRRGIRVRPKPL